MNERQEASIMLETFDELAPVCIDWNNEDLWIKAITEGMRRIKAAKAETPAAATAGARKK